MLAASLGNHLGAAMEPAHRFHVPHIACQRIASVARAPPFALHSRNIPVVAEPRSGNFGRESDNIGCDERRWNKQPARAVNREFA